MSLTAESVPRQTPGFRMEILNNEVILLRPSDGKIIQCNQTAGVVWQLCDGNRSVRDIVHLLREAYPEPGERVVTDVHDTLATLAAANAITIL